MSGPQAGLSDAGNALLAEHGENMSQAVVEVWELLVEQRMPFPAAISVLMETLIEAFHVHGRTPEQFQAFLLEVSKKAPGAFELLDRRDGQAAPPAGNA